MKLETPTTVETLDLDTDIRLLQRFNYNGQDGEQGSNVIEIEAVPVAGYMGVTVFASAKVYLQGTLTAPAVLTKPDSSTVNLSAGPFNQTLDAEGFYYMESSDLTKLSFEGSDGQFLLDPRSDIDTVTDLSKAFKDCQFYNQSLDFVDPNGVTNFSEMFSGSDFI